MNELSGNLDDEQEATLLGISNFTPLLFTSSCKQVMR